MNKYIKHALKDWADAKGFEIHFYANAGRDSSYYLDKQKSQHPHPILDLDWWREVPILDWVEYENELMSIIKETFIDKPLDECAMFDVSKAYHNATIAQRCEAKYKADQA